MIILDTNVISEAMRGPQADPRVIAWIRGLSEQPVTTVVNRAEILAGIALLPASGRREQLAAAAGRAFSGLGTCLPLVPECAEAYGAIVATRSAAGRPMGSMDALIAAIARVSGAGLATRDTTGFEGLDLVLVDPWAG